MLGDESRVQDGSGTDDVLAIRTSRGVSLGSLEMLGRLPPSSSCDETVLSELRCEPTSPSWLRKDRLELPPVTALTGCTGVGTSAKAAGTGGADTCHCEYRREMAGDGTSQSRMGSYTIIVVVS